MLRSQGKFYSQETLRYWGCQLHPYEDFGVLGFPGNLQPQEDLRP